MGLIGLTYIDRLSLRWFQWAALGLFSLFPVWWGRWVVLAAFLNQQVSTDTRLLFQECRYLSSCSWSQFLSEFSLRNYIGLQNPFVVFAISRLPVFLVWQLLLLLPMMDVRPTPLSLLMMTQPSPDLISFLLIRSSWHSAKQSNMIAAVSFGVGCIIKSSALVLLPFMACKLQGWLVVSVVMIGLYWTWFFRYHAGRKQLRFLRYLGFLSRADGTPHKRSKLRAVRRRITRYHGGAVLMSLIVYLFPAYISFSWPQWVIIGILTLIAPNVKYYLLVEVLS